VADIWWVKNKIRKRRERKRDGGRVEEEDRGKKDERAKGRCNEGAVAREGVRA
jgi:hypothetical protein